MFYTEKLVFALPYRRGLGREAGVESWEKLSGGGSLSVGLPSILISTKVR